MVEKLLAVPTYKKRYLAHYKTILSEMITSGTYSTDAAAMQTLILASVTADVNKFSYQTLSNFTANLSTTDVSSSGNTAPGLTGLMSARATYLNGLADFTNTQPVIASIASLPASPVVGGNVTVTANVTNTTVTEVYLGYRIARNDIFVKVKMYDDGAHGDGAASDNVYGATIPVLGAEVQYYIYAENANVGMFSPARAEYEYYKIAATFEPIKAGELTVNEIMASNTKTVTDASGKYEDWFELYNNTSKTLSLEDLYATDDNTNKLKWKFPSGTTIAPGGYLIVWADGDLTEPGVHADFKFSTSGESCVLSYASGDVVDSVTFGAQISDSSYSRIPNGTGSFVIKDPTYNGNNEWAASIKAINEQSTTLRIFPNPVSSTLNIVDEKVSIETVEVYDMLGHKIISNNYSNQNNVSIDLSEYANGMNLLFVNKESKIKVIKNN